MLMKPPALALCVWCATAVLEPIASWAEVTFVDRTA